MIVVLIMVTETLQKVSKISKEKLKEIAVRLSKKHGGVAACILNLVDKTILAENIPEGIDKERFLRVAFGFGSILSKHTSELGIGDFEETIIKGNRGWLVIIHRDGLAVVGVFSMDVNLALAETATKNSALELWGLLK